jgi:hypothetical protein
VNLIDFIFQLTAEEWDILEQFHFEIALAA